MRGLVGKAFGANVFSLPPDQRFYAGGSGTVRGFRYQSIGPQFPDGKPTGGTAVSAASVELRQRILEHYGVVAFVDAGQVTAERLAVHQQLAGRSGYRGTVLHLDRANSSRCRNSIEPRAPWRRFRTVHRHRAGLLMRRAAKWIGWVLAVLAVLPVVLLVAANTPPGQRAIAWLTPRLTGDTVRLAGLSGRFPDALHVARFELRDAQGAYATIEGLALDWSPLQLLHRRLVIDRLEADHVDALRMPAGSSSGSSSLPVPVVLHELHVARLDIAPALAGTVVAVALDGSGEFASPTDFTGRVDIRQLDGGGSYAISGTADATRLQATLHASEPAHGLVAGLAGLPDLGDDGAGG